METIILTVFLVFVFGAILLILGMGYRSMEEERGKKLTQEFELACGPTVPIPSRLNGRAAPLDDALLMRVQRYVDREQALADAFVSQPSVETLYSVAGGSSKMN